MKFLRGDLIAEKYRVIDRLGEGGMGVVLLAKHELLGMQVAVKVTHGSSSEPEQRERFLREGRIMAQVSSAHAVRLNDVGQLPSGELFLVMERLEGKDLSTTVEREGPLPIPIAVDVVIQALDALSEAHSLGIVHRDLKPANIFLTRDASGKMLAKVLDFGISKATKEDVSLTSTGAVMGSPLYMSPEQIRSAKSAHVGTDIWALGVVLFEALTGQTPFNGNTAGEVFTAILEAQLPPIHRIRPEIPPGLIQVIGKCLAKHMSERFQSCGELAQALAPYGTGQCQLNVARAIGFAPQKLISNAAGLSSSPFLPTPISSGTLPLSASSSGHIGNASTQQSWTDVSNVGGLAASSPSSSLLRVFLAVAVAMLGIGVAGIVWAVKARAHKDTLSETPSVVVAASAPPVAASSAPAVIASAVPTTNTTTTTTTTTISAPTAQPPAWVPPTPTRTGRAPLKDSSRTKD